MEKQTGNLQTLAWILSVAGFVPFAILAVVLFMLNPANALYSFLFDVFKVWSAIILSFLGGIRWGLAIARAPGEPGNLFFSVGPSILAWFAIMLPNAYTILLLVLLYSAQGAWDNFYVNTGRVLPWFGMLRIVLTFLVVSAHILVLFSITGTPDMGKLGEFLQQL